MEALLGFIVTIGSLFLMFFIFQWIMSKIFGVHFYGKYEARKAFQDQQEIAKVFEDYTKKNPELINKAIDRCRKKGFAKTHSNILLEIKKIEDERNGKESLSNKIGRNINSIGDRFIFDNSKSKIEKLERINTLRLNGGLSDDEYKNFKNQILNNQMKYDASKVTSDSKINYFSELDKQEAIKTINLLYLEYKDKLEFLKHLELSEVHKIILENQNTIALVKNYKNLFNLYTNDLISQEEFNSKKEKLLIKSINTNNYGTF